MKYTLYVKYEGKNEPVLDADDTTSICMGMVQLLTAGVKSEDMFAVDNTTNKILMSDALYV